VRGRHDPVEPLTVPLPKRSAEELAKEPVVVLRVPEQGGVAPPDVRLPRGLLLLRITAGSKTDEGVERVSIAEGRLSLPPRPAKPRKSEPAEPLAEASLEESTQRIPQKALWVLVAAGWVALVLYFAAHLPH
jgi:hypothetical protein